MSLETKLKIIALRCSTDLNYTQLGKRFGMSGNTIQRVVTTNPFA